MNTEDISYIERAMQRRLEAMPSHIRPFTTEMASLPRTLILTGPRGCGKSTFLLYHSLNKSYIYISVDNPLVVAQSLYKVVSEFFMMGYEGVILDEIHYATDWSLHLKALHDDYPDKTIWASDSSSLVLRQGSADISRRYVSMSMPLMSFREFLYLETGQLYGKYHIGDNVLPVTPDASILRLFQEYKKHGTRPFYTEGDFDARYRGVLDKVLDSDIPFFLPAVTDNNLRLMRAIVGTLATSSIPRISVSSLCNDWNVGAEKLYQLLFVMEHVGLIRIARYPNDTKARSVGAKMFFADPCAYEVLGGDGGTRREAIVANCLSNAGYTVNAMRNEKQGDFLISKPGQTLAIEVGGAGKNPKESDYVIRDNIDYPSSKAIPLWLLAMTW